MVCSRRSELTIACLLGFLVAPAWAQNTINVPGKSPTIQAGINAAANGDTVLVAPGTYVENIDFMGKAITVTSSAGPTATTIDGGQKGVVVNFANNETRASVINGFTITDDAPPLPTQVPFGTDGIFVGNANPTITNNIITNNRRYGIEVSFGSAYISGNSITLTNTAGDPSFDFGCDFDDGDGIFIGGASNSITDPPVIDHNTIEQNVGHCDGGGIGLYAAPDSTIISNNIIANNQSLGFGGGVYEVNGSVSLNQNLIYNNVSGAAGGGVYLSIPSEVNGATGPLNVFVTNNTIYGNTISLNPLIQDAWVDGSQVALPAYVGQLGFFNNLILANDSYSAFACWPVYQYLSGAAPVVVYSDVRNTGGAPYGGWCTTPEGNTGNISADPKFNNPSIGDFHLEAGSPAIDTGFNAAPGSLATDFGGNPRIQNAAGASEPLVDMGAYEASGAPESRLLSMIALTAQPDTVFYGQPVTLSSAVTGATPITQGGVNFMDDWSVIQQSPLNASGVATASTSSLGVGPHWLVASFGGNAADQPSVSTTAEVVVNGFSTATTLVFSPNPGQYGQPETLTATTTLAPGNPPGTGMPTGNIAFIGLNVAATVPLNASGVATYTTSSLPAGDNYIQAIYKPTGGFLSSDSVNLDLQIAGFAISGTAMSVSPGATSGNQSTITVIPSGGFIGNVTLRATITSSPSGAQDPPTLSFGSTSPVAISGASAGTATLTVSTTPAANAALAYPERPGARWFNIGSGGLAFALAFGIGVPAQRRSWRMRFGLFVFLLTLAGALLACGGGGSAGGGGGRAAGSGGGNTGTTAGTYTVTVTGTSGNTTASGAVTLIVQ